MAAAALTMGFASCSSDDLPNSHEVQVGNTNVAVSLSLSLGNTTRALPNEYNYVGEWAGKDNIQTVDIYLVDAIKASVIHQSFSVAAGEYVVAASPNASNQIILTPKKAIKTTAGQKAVYAVINTTPEITAALTATTIPAFDNAFKTVAMGLANSGTSTTVSTSASKIANVDTSKDVIVMTNSEDVTLNVLPNITSDQTLASGADATKNRVGVKVERAVARVMITTKQISYDVMSGATKVGTVSDITWVLAQGENSLYIQRKSDYMSPSYGWKPADDAAYYANAGSMYDYSGLFENKTNKQGGTTIPTLVDYSTANSTSIGESSILDGKFILPTTHTYGAETASFYKKGNTAYILVRATYKPELFADGGTANTDGTFYLGANGKYYTSATNAVDPTKGGVTNQTVAKYEKGKVLYYVWVNPDNTDTGNWYNSPVLRNNIYHVHITGFKTIGTNWNPLYPEDPNTATPTNPDPKPTVNPGDPQEPTNPIDPTDPLTTPETWMSVDVTVLPWQVHSYVVQPGI